MTLGRRRYRTTHWLAAAIVTLLAAGMFWLCAAFGAVVTGFFAKSLCSSVFVSGREAQSVVDDDLLIYWPRPLFAAVSWQLDRGANEVRATLPLGLGSGRAIHQPGAGCATVGRHAAPADPVPRPVQDRMLAYAAATAGPWPQGDEPDDSRLSASVRRRLAAALDAGFAEPASTAQRRTRAIVIVHRGRIVAERYAPGFDATMRLPGWSMAKSVTAAWLACLPPSALARLDDRIALRAWSGADDPRAAMTFRQALTMTTGLDASEQYASPFSDVNRMLFVDGDTGNYAASRPLASAPGTVFQYSSGTTNLISLAIRERLVADYAQSPYKLLLDRIGMRSAVLERDIAGTYVGSSYLLATARDWARVGQLFLRDGLWNGERLLPAGWVAFSRQPTPVSSVYGAHWWLHEPSADAVEMTAGRPAAVPPADLFQATGHAGQRISIVPSQDLVIVRLGQTLYGPALRHAELIGDVIAALHIENPPRK